MIIEYSPKGVAVSDFELESYVESLGIHAHAVVSTENVIWKVKQLIANGQLNHEQVTFVFEGKEIHPNYYGAVLDWPEGFADTQNRIAEDTMLAAYKKTKRHK